MGKQLTRLICLLLLPLAASAKVCTSAGSGNVSTLATWTAANSCSTLGVVAGDSLIISANHAVTQDVAGLVLGGSGAPVYGYIDALTTVSAGSGYTSGCGGAAFTGGTMKNSHGGSTICRVVNGQAIVHLGTRGIYSDLTGVALGAVTSTNVTLTGTLTTKGNPTTLYMNSITPWTQGSTQSITIAGVTGGWTSCGPGSTSLNGNWTATASNVTEGGTYFTVPFDSSGCTGTPSGTITVAPGTTASYTFTTVAGGGTAAVAIGSGTASFTFAANTTVRGDVTYNSTVSSVARAITFNPGVTVTMDSTLAAGTPMYSILGSNAITDYRQLYARCAGNPCRLEAAGNITRIEAARGGYFDLDSMHFYRVGDASTPALFGDVNWVSAPSSAVMSIINSVFDTCGRIKTGNGTVPGDLAFTYEGNTHKNTPAGAFVGAAAMIDAGFLSGSKTTGSRTIRRNVFDKALAYNFTLGLLDVTLEDNYIGGQPGFFRNVEWTAFTRNFVSTPSAAGDSAGGPTITDSYWLLDVDSVGNPHWLTFPSTGGMVTGSIFGFSGRDIPPNGAIGDSGEIIQTASNSAVTYGARNSIFLCDSTGVGSSAISSVGGPYPLAIWAYEHNTFCGGYRSWGPIQTDETGNVTAGNLTYRSNLMWSEAASTNVKIKNTCSSPCVAETVNPCTTGMCDYNGSWHYTLTPNNGYDGGSWTTVTPGVYDVDAKDPGFVDRFRKAENWDRNYLWQHGLISSASARPATWTAGTYTTGDLRSHAHASLYGGEILNFRCVAASCTLEPGVPGTAWRDQWEWAALYQIRALMETGTTITDTAIGCSGCRPVAALVAWVKAGFAPTNRAFYGAAHEGAGYTIGAVGWTPAPRQNFGLISTW